MADTLKEWLRTRLGTIMDLTPETFGRYARDGTLLAQILHSYDIINSNQLSTITPTRDPALSRVNLRTLQIWLKLINVTLSEKCINDISKDKGAASLQLFYKVYLSLEGKDRLHFIALQKEQKYMNSRFNVFKVPDDLPSYIPSEHPLSTPLIKAADTVLWHRKKFWAITKACRQERERFEALMEYPVIQPIEHFVPEKLPDKKQEESKILDEFTRKHPACKTKKIYQVECCPSKRILDVSCIEDPTAAAEYIDFLKKRSKKMAKCHELKLKTQTTMMAETWERLLRKQDRFFDEALGRRVLDQSRYEKQMLRKLCEVRNLRSEIVETRRIVDTMLLKAKNDALRFKQYYQDVETIKEEREDVEMEISRMCELKQRIREEKMRRMKEKHQDICLEIMNDFVDIAVKLADYRQANGNHIPNSIWNEWKMLFLKNQPIFEYMDYFDDVEEADNIEEIENEQDMKMNEDEEKNGARENEKDMKMNEDEKKNGARENSGERVRNEEGIQIGKALKVEENQKLLQLERQQSLTDVDFESYRDLASPWDQFVPKREKEVEEVYRLGCVVLGYIVHRLLEILYPYSAKIMDCPVPRVKVAAIILGVANAALHRQLQKLLKNIGIRLLTMEDAINHCLESYKREMVDVEYIDLNIISTTERDIKRLETKSKNDSRERHPKKIERSAKSTPFHQNVAEEKQTQTPRQIPYDDMNPILSDTAYIGKWTYEFLTLGQPISNELSTKILIEYLKGIGDVEGWALINYPNTYEQMAMLEKALTGREIPPDPVKLTDVNVENIDPPSVRIVFEDDTFAIYRQSRLLPNPISKAKDYTSSMTFMTIYIKAMPKSNAIDSQEQTCIPLPDNATSMDEFYANQDIAYGFFYKNLDLSVSEQLAKFITDHFYGKKLPLKLSEKILQADHTKQNQFTINSKTAVIKRLIPKSKWKPSECEEKEAIEAESRSLQSEIETQLGKDYAKPGESNWQWLDFSQSTALLKILATLWESVEQAYIENLKEILSLKRMHMSAIIPHKKLVFRNLMRFIDRPDKRQILLQDFHQAFNEIDDDLRKDLDMKCELHCQVDDFRKELWELCDARRYEAEEERKRTLRNQWILMEAVVLVNVYIGILQTEVDRFVDTMQLLQDYYTSMLQKPLQESRFSKIVLDNIELEDVLQEILDKDKEQMTKIKSIATSARIIDKDQFKTEIETLLIDVSKSFDSDQNIIYNIIKDNIRKVRGTVDFISTLMLDMLKKEEKAVILKTEIKSKGDSSADSTFAKLTRRHHDLVEEWRYAVLFEIDRIHQRLDVLNAAARSDVTFFIDIMKQTFHRIHHHIIERYKRDIESIDEMANVFCFAIEEERPIQQELLLDGDRFVVRSNIVSKDHEQFNVPIREAPSPLRFRMVQLGRLVDIFQRIAPHGIVSERVLVYVLQDLVSCGIEDCYPPFVPCAWRQLRPPDIEILVERLFGSTEYIEWREFVLYAMDLPVPSHQDILKARAAFKIHDSESKEVVTCEQFHSISLWFLEISTLYKNFLDEKLEQSNFDSLENIMLRKEAQLGEHFSSLGNDFIERSEDDSSTILRLMLAKQLLCRMYLVNRDSVHYTTMLLAFCKNENPSVGLGKAFSLAMGARVCTDTVEGEKYVEELAEQKRRVKELKLRQNYLREEVNEIVQEIMNDIINKTIETIVLLEKSPNHDLRSKRRVKIQQSNGQNEVDPAELLPEVIAEHLVTENSSTISDEYEHKHTLLPIEDETLEDHKKIQQDEKVIFWLPRDVCVTVLSTCLPWLASQADLFHTTLSLCEGIARVYDELRDEELNDAKDLVLAHRLVNHSFICELLCASSKFISKNMSDILRYILKDKNDQMT